MVSVWCIRCLLFAYLFVWIHHRYIRRLSNDIAVWSNNADWNHFDAVEKKNVVMKLLDLCHFLPFFCSSSAPHTCSNKMKYWTTFHNHAVKWQSWHIENIFSDSETKAPCIDWFSSMPKTYLKLIKFNFIVYSTDFRSKSDLKFVQSILLCAFILLTFELNGCLRKLKNLHSFSVDLWLFI